MGCVPRHLVSFQIFDTDSETIEHSDKNPCESEIQRLSKPANSLYNTVRRQKVNKHMKKFIVCLLLGTLLGTIPPLLPAQQNQSAQKSDTEIEALKKRISKLEKQLQTVENVENLDLQAKLAEANAKLAKAEFGKFERELRDSNNEWLRNRVIILLAFLSVVGVGIWSWLKYRTNQLIETEVEKNLNGFKAAVDQVEVMKDELAVLKKEHVASVLETIIGYGLQEEHYYPEHIKVLREEMLLQILNDEAQHPAIRYKAAEVLIARKFPRLVSPLLNFLNSLVDSDLGVLVTNSPEDAVIFLADIQTPEAYQGLTEFLNRLLTENPKNKNWFLEETLLSLVKIDNTLGIGDLVPILKKALPDLENPGHEVLSELVEYFDRFNESTSIKKILVNYLEDETHMDLPEKQLADRCLELLQKHDPEFVKERRARETTDNSAA